MWEFFPDRITFDKNSLCQPNYTIQNRSSALPQNDPGNELQWTFVLAMPFPLSSDKQS